MCNEKQSHDNLYWKPDCYSNEDAIKVIKE